jgi:fermentation-respiration switch protein FrsA (DUF1100 family)
MFNPAPEPEFKLPQNNPEGYRNPGDLCLKYEDVIITTDDGVKLHGWFIPSQPTYPLNSKPRTLVYFHGKGCNMGVRLKCC